MGTVWVWPWIHEDCIDESVTGEDGKENVLKLCCINNKTI